VYHCPADKSVDAVSGFPRVRSVSANCFVGPSISSAESNVDPAYPSYAKFRKSSDFGGAMSSSLVIVYLDENVSSINDGFFFGNPTLNGIGDRPAVNHGHASSLSFADGHSEIHPWKNTFLNTNSVGGIAAKQSDGVWLATHLSFIP
jgi:hypothetical protein